jgi:uncharacterized membrane protein YeiH
VFWLSDTATLGLAVAGGLSAFAFHRAISRFRPLRWADALGMAVFAVTGAAKAMALGHALPVILIMGAMTASAGGLIRDVVANEEPLLLKQDIYATAALLAALVYFVGIRLGTGELAAVALGVLAGLVLRGLGIVFGLSLPRSRP